MNKNQVIRTATDKGGEAFFQLASWLFVIDDMSGSYQKRVRALWWNWSKKQDATVEELDRFIKLNYPDSTLPKMMKLEKFYNLMWQAIEKNKTTRHTKTCLLTSWRPGNFLPFFQN